MKSLTLNELTELQAVVTGDYSYISQGHNKTVIYIAHWPSNRHVTLRHCDNYTNTRMAWLDQRPYAA
jgi:hypothetical protein